MIRLLVGVAALAAFAPASLAANTPVTDQAQQAGIAQTAQSFDTLVFDYDADAVPDFLYSPQNAATGRQLWHGNPDGTFTLQANLVGVSTNDQHGCTTGDYDHNALADVYCTLGAIHGSRAKRNSLFLQTTPGVFGEDPVTGAEDAYGRSYSASTLDANADGWPDLFVSNFHPRPDGLPTPDRLFLNLGADANTGAWLGFAAASTSGLEVEQGNRGCNFATDFTGDGLDDIVFCGTQTMRWMQNNADGTFTDVHRALLGGDFFTADAKLIDLNGDGLRDLVYVRLTQQGIRLRRADGTFAPATQIKALKAGRTVEVTDVTGDGILDLFIVEGNGPPGCTNCAPNQPDRLYQGEPGGVFRTLIPTPQVTTGSGDTVDAIGRRLLIGNGASLRAGPLQLLAAAP